MSTLDLDYIYGYNGQPVTVVNNNPTAAASATAASSELNSAASGNETLMYPSVGGVLIAALDGSKQSLWMPSDGSHQVTAIAVHEQTGAIVVAERRLKVTLLVFDSNRKLIQKANDAARLEVNCMSFCREGTRLAVLAGPPAHNISLYNVDVATGKLAHLYTQRTPNEHQFNAITFNPRSPGGNELCTSGGGYLYFWKYDKQSSPPGLIPIEGRMTAPNVRATCHVWSPLNLATVQQSSASPLGSPFGSAANLNATGGLNSTTALDRTSGSLQQAGSGTFASKDQQSQQQQPPQPVQVITEVLVGTRAGQIFAFDPQSGIGTLRFDTVTGSTIPSPEDDLMDEDGEGGNNGGAGGERLHEDLQAVMKRKSKTGAHGSPAIVTIAATRHHMIVASADGQIRFMNHLCDELSKVILTHGAGVPSQLRAIHMFPDYQGIICCNNNGITSVKLPGYNLSNVPTNFHTITENVKKTNDGPGGKLVGACFVGQDNLFVELSAQGFLRVIDVQANRVEAKIHVGSRVSSLAADTVTPTVLIGSNDGVIRVVSLANRLQPQIVVKDKILKTDTTPIHHIVVDPTLRMAALFCGERDVCFFALGGGEAATSLPHVSSLVRVPEHLERVNDLVFVSDERVKPCVLIATNNSTVVHMDIPSEQTHTISDKDFFCAYEEVVQNSWRLDLPFRKLALGAIHENSFFAFGSSLDRATKIISMDRSQAPDRKDRESKALKTPLAFNDHDKVATSLRLINKRWLVSTGSDGKIAIRDVSALVSVPSPNYKEWIRPAPAHAFTRHVADIGGIVGCSFSHDGSRCVTVGGDGQTVLWAAFGQSACARLTPLNLGTATTCAIEEDKDDETMYFLDKRRLRSEELDRMKGESHRKQVKERVLELRDKLQALRQENDRAEEDEKVELTEFLVERDRKRFQDAVDACIAEKKDEVHWKDVRCDYVADVLKKRCWNTMSTQLTCVQAMKKEDAIVHNFGVRATEKHEATIIKKLKFLRRVEEKDREARGVKSEIEGIRADEAAAAAEKPKIPPMPTNENGELVLDTPLEQDILEDVTPYLYHPWLLFSKNRAIIQINLLSAKSLQNKTTFNKQFSTLVGRKKNDIAVINDRNARCRLIQKELDDHQELFSAAMNPIEDCNRLLTVEDSEVPAERTHDPEYKAKIAAEEAEKERWRRVHGTDDSSDRALKDWMDGRLEKEIKVLAVRLTPPDFADEKNEAKYVPPDERTEEQVKALRDYEKKYQKAQEEVNARRQQLTTELRNLQKDNDQAAKKFDEAVQQLLMQRLMCAQRCYEIDLQRVKLAQGIVFQQDRNVILGKMEKRRLWLDEKVIAASNTTKAFNAQLAEKKLEYTQLEQEETRKKSDKTLKSVYPFNESEELYKWYMQQLQHRRRDRRGRGRQQGQADDKGQKAGGPQGGRKHHAMGAQAEAAPVNMDPWSFIEEEAQQKAQIQREEIAAAQQAAQQFVRPEAFSDQIWDQFMQYQQERQIGERTLKRLKEEIDAMTAEAARLATVEEELSVAAKRARSQAEQYLRDTLREQYDIDELHIFRQGQVEVEQAPIVTEYGNAVLIDAKRINDLNAEITRRGEEKVTLMIDALKRQHQIEQIKWEIDGIVYDTETTIMETRQLQTLKVTKHMQEFIGGGGAEHNEKTRKKLQEKIEHVRESMANKIEERKGQMQKIKRMTREKEMENVLLLDQVSEAESLVSSRRQIFDLQSSEMEKERTSKLMRDMRVTRKLEDVALAQQDEMKALKKEIDRLRERTFPSFAVVSKRVIGNPDEA